MSIIKRFFNRTAQLPILKENIHLPFVYKDRPIGEMMSRQEELIKDYENLGFTRKEFFDRSRILVTSRRRI